LITNAFGTGAGISFYDLIAVIVALTAAVFIVTIRQLYSEGEHTSTIFAVQCSYGLVICFIPVICNWTTHSLTAWILMLIAEVCAGIGQIAMTLSFVTCQLVKAP
jgi:drug/metabolite transporter (DMT)-like permease